MADQAYNMLNRSLAHLPCIHFVFNKSISQGSKFHPVLENKTYFDYFGVFINILLA